MAIDQIRDAILSGDRSEETYANLPLPDTYRATTVHKDEVEMFKGLKSRDKDPRKSLHIDDVPIPELAPDEALVAVMASAINFNTVWTSIFEPVSTFGFLERYGRLNKYSKRHDLPYHIVGSDLSGVVLRTGGHVSKWKPGQEVVAHCLSVELEDADGHDDTMMDPQQRIWGFETNFGGLAELAIVKANQLMPKPEHLTWEESASPGLVNSTAYRQLISKNGAALKLGVDPLGGAGRGGLPDLEAHALVGDVKVQVDRRVVRDDLGPHGRVARALEVVAEVVRVVDHQVVAVGLDRSRIAAVHRVALEQQGVGLGVGKIVDRHQLQIVAAVFDQRARHQASDASEAVDGDLDRHDDDSREEAGAHRPRFRLRDARAAARPGAVLDDGCGVI